MKPRTKTASFFYILFAVIFMGGHIVAIPPILCNLFIALCGFGALGYCVLKKGFDSTVSYYIVLGVLFSMLMFLSVFYNGNADYLDILWVWAYLGIAALIYEFDIPSRTYWAVAYAVIALIAVYMLTGGAIDGLLKIGSQNNISTYVFFFVLVGYLSQMAEKRPMQYIPTFLVLAISLWSGSRAGLLAAAALLVCIFFYNFLALQKGKLKTLGKIFALILLALLAVTYFFGEYMVAFLEKIKNYGGSSVRTEIWAEYIGGMFDSLRNFVFGVKMSDKQYTLLNYYTGNTHNAFLMLHAKYGIVAVFAALYYACKAFLRSLSEKNRVLIIVLIAAAARMFFDWVAFPGLYDVFVWYAIIYAIDNRSLTESTGITDGAE